jgi:hypothetical protein
VGYYLEEDEEEDTFILYRREGIDLTGDPEEDGIPQELARSVWGLDIDYLDAGGEEREDWDPSSGDGATGLPNLIQIRLVLRDASGRERQFSTSVHPALAGLN